MGLKQTEGTEFSRQMSLFIGGCTWGTWGGAVFLPSHFVSSGAFKTDSHIMA